MTTTVMETIYRKIALEGVWLVDPKQTNYEQQQAILALRKAGRIEMAAYGGLKVKHDWRANTNPAPQPDTAAIRDLLASAGITPTRPVVECRDARKRPGNAPSWCAVIPADAKLPAGLFADGYFREGKIVVFQLKGE